MRISSLLAGIATAVVIGAVVFSTQFVSASHGACGSNALYYHVHWYRDEGDPNRNVVFRYFTVNESGATGEYEPAIDGEMAEWESGQSFAEFIETTGSSYNISVTTSSWPAEFWSGSVTLDPDQCSTSSSTHADDLGDSKMRMNSYVIEGETDPDTQRDRTASHELGHVLGLGHSTSSSRVMYVGANSVTGPTSADLDQLDGQSDPFGHLHSGGS